MAVTTINNGLSQEKGINYTVITDSSADWASVANDTYFYDLADGLPHYKDGSGNVLEVFASGGGTDTNLGNSDLTQTSLTRTYTIGTGNQLKLGTTFSVSNGLLTVESPTFIEQGGNSDSLNIKHTSGLGLGARIVKSGDGEGIFLDKVSGAGNAMTIQGGILSMTNQKITNVSNPTNAQDVATKNYVDGLDANNIKKNSATHNKTFTLESPTATEDMTIFRTDVAITVQEVIAVSVGTSPSTTYQLKHSTDRNAAGNALTTSSTTTSTTTGNVATLSTPAIPANSWVWFETTAATGTNVRITIDIRYTID